MQVNSQGAAGMHGLMNRSIQCFLRDTYGTETWYRVARRADIDPAGFEAMLVYEDALTERTLEAAMHVLQKSREDLLEDLGTYLVSHPNVEALRRLLRFGGESFVDFLHSLDELPDRARLAVPDLGLPRLELRQTEDSLFRLRCSWDHPGFGHVLVGLLRTLADDYGTLAFLEFLGRHGNVEEVGIRLLDARFASGRRFELAGS